LLRPPPAARGALRPGSAPRIRVVWRHPPARPEHRFRARQVFIGHRPWLVFSAGRYRSRGWLDDTLRAEGRGDKAADDHPWRQALGPFRRLVTMFTKPGELVLDPLCGSGTTLLAAVEEDRRALGIDEDRGALVL